ncbi:hypothetical protein [Spirosoma linguale]|uniref:Uncharacterized protein n=1 Tax=Spirosoma linguale (strain ATCC 33905 / DSM 74 / LMG 10896 / Claus 1) TaxID=504472 RepID=D2QN39_SPILD|nr:hypothetical protein Slin_1473 [Spirosoma linguale DSM 74]
MPERIRLYPECHADTTLITYLVSDSQLIEHAAGINEVSKSLQTVKSDDTILIGIVDNDKHKPRYLREFETIEERDKVCFMHKPGSNQYLLIIDKAIETFLLWNALQVNLIITDYGFNTDVKQLGARLKSRAIETDPNYLRLLSDLHAQQAPGFITLERILNDLITT